MDDAIRDAVHAERLRMEAEFADLRNRLEGRHTSELKDLQHMMEEKRIQY
jgi:hypothetical protein